MKVEVGDWVYFGWFTEPYGERRKFARLGEIVWGPDDKGRYGARWAPAHVTTLQPSGNYHVIVGKAGRNADQTIWKPGDHNE